MIEARAQVDELKDALESREGDLKDIRQALLEREEELAVASERIAELQATQDQTHDRLEETMKAIELDNEEKEADLIAANKELEIVSVSSTNGLALTTAWSACIRAGRDRRRAQRSGGGSRHRPAFSR